MSSLTIVTRLPKDIYTKDNLAQAMRDPVQQFKVKVDADSKTILSFFTKVNFSGYKNTDFPNRYERKEGKVSCKYVPKTEEPEWLVAIENSLKFSWADLVRNFPERDLALVEGEVNITFYTTMEKVSAVLTHTHSKKNFT